MAIVMNMSSYVVEQAPSQDVEYAEEASRTGWNPQLELATHQHLATLMDKHATLPASLLTADAELFLQKMYAYQC
jgi:hypothetical protein